MGKTLGIILLIGGVVVGAIIIALMTVYRGEGSLTAGAATLGIVIGFLVLVLPQLGFGAYLLVRGQQEAVIAESAGNQRKMLGMIKAKGQAFELMEAGVPRIANGVGVFGGIQAA